MVTVLDLPEVIDMMQPELDKNLPIKLVKGDFTIELPADHTIWFYLGNVCHIYGEQENRKLFIDAAKELVPGGRIVINDLIRGTGVRPAVFAVNMLINTPSGEHGPSSNTSHGLLLPVFPTYPGMKLLAGS